MENCLKHTSSLGREGAEVCSKLVLFLLPFHAPNMLSLYNSLGKYNTHHPPEEVEHGGDLLDLLATVSFIYSRCQGVYQMHSSREIWPS